jgi:hypothetical protein
MRVTGDIGIGIEDLMSSKREKKISYARGIISYLGAVKLGHNGTRLAKALRMSRKSVSRCLSRLPCRSGRSYMGRSGRSYWDIQRGKKILDNNQKMLEYLS